MLEYVDSMPLSYYDPFVELVIRNDRKLALVREIRAARNRGAAAEPGSFCGSEEPFAPQGTRISNFPILGVAWRLKMGAAP